MSKPISYDSLLVRALAAELHARYERQRVRSMRFDDQNRVLHVFFRRVTLEWNLDPAGGALAETPAFGVATGTQLPKGTSVTAIRARPDDRVIDWVLHAPAHAGHREFHLWVLLLPNRRSATLVGAHGHRIADAAGAVEPAAAFRAPDYQPRRGAESLVSEADFVARLTEVQPEMRAGVLLAEFAFTSPINVAAILGPAASEPGSPALAESWRRYARCVASPTEPVVLDPGGAAQPYPVALPGVPCSRYESLLAAFAAVRGEAETLSQTGVLAALRHRQHALEKRIARMHQESRHALREAEEWRQMGNLLLSQLSGIGRGQREAVLDDWTGGTVRVPLDPALGAAENANRLFEKARKRERAAIRLPAMIEKASRDALRLSRTADGLASGEVSVADASALLPAPPSPVTRRPARLPYRRYRTSGGLEVRVGKNSKANDELTQRHSSAEDIWMHARDAAGAHVVLRWTHRDENPPAADLIEAAVLAALHSRAASSGAVAIDWTRRKHVRKPRKAPPGLVMVERTRTLFVEPDPRVELRLRQD